MEGRILATPEKLRATSSQFGDTNNRISKLTAEMTGLINGSMGVWTGEAAQAYNKKFTDLQRDIAKINKMINEHVQDLQQMASEYEAAEQANISQAQSLKTDVIV